MTHWSTNFTWNTLTAGNWQLANVIVITHRKPIPHYIAVRQRLTLTDEDLIGC